MRSKTSIISSIDRYFNKYFKEFYNLQEPPFVCASCGEPKDNITMGHYISRAHLTTRWLIANVAPQCHKCNTYLSGEAFALRRFLIDKHGADTIMAIEDMALKRKNISKDELLLLLNKIKKEGLSTFGELFDLMGSLC